MSKLFLLAIGLPGMSFVIVMMAAADETLPGLSTLILPMSVILLLVLLNGFFVAAEIAIVGVRPTKLEEMADGGDKVARTVLGVVESRTKQDRYIATAQLGITIASLGLAMYGEPRIAHFIEAYLERVPGIELTEAVVATLGYVVALSLLTYLHIVVGEMVPKSLALADSAKIALALTRPMQFVQTILTIPVRMLNAVGFALLRLLKIPPAEGHERVLSPEELELIVTESAEGGLLNEEEEEMIRNIFDFGERMTGQVMTPRTKVQAIPHDILREELLKLVAESKHSRFPVFRGDLDHIIGVLHVKDLVRQTLKMKSSFDLRLLVRSVPAVPENYPAELLLAAFKRSRLHMAIVLDEFGGMAGIVTLEDLVEEIVGEVRDEFDLEKEPFVKIEPGVIEVAGSYLVDELVEDVYLGNEERLPDVETVGGLIVTGLGRLPAVGDEVVYNEDVSMKVLAVERRAVARARITFPVPEEEENGTTADSAGRDKTNPPA